MENSERCVYLWDAEELTGCDKLVLFIANNKPKSYSRIQCIASIFSQLIDLEPNDDFNIEVYNGHSDSIDESIDTLIGTGMMDCTDNKFPLSSYGQILLNYLEQNKDNLEKSKQVSSIMDVLDDASDRCVVGLIHHYCAEMSLKPMIKRSVERTNKHLSLNGKPLQSTD